MKTWTMIWLALWMCSARAGEQVGLETLDLGLMRQGWGIPVVNRSVETNALRMAGAAYSRGVGSHAPGSIRLELDGRTTRFRARIGVDDETGGYGSVVFKAYADGKPVYDSGVIRGGDTARVMDLDLTGVKGLILLMENGGDHMHFDHANWADAEFTVEGKPPCIVDAPREERVILTPPPVPEPRLQGPRVYGVRPGSPFLYRIPCTGERPILFRAVNLPDGLVLDVDRGIIRGTMGASTGTYAVVLHAENSHGADQRDFRIVAGNTLALTPPMGWNSWYIHYHRVTQEDMVHAAETMVRSGMADVGYQYVNIDDCWMKKKGDTPYRDAAGDLLCNDKFPDMRDMVDRIHELGLKAGTYISPGPWTCAGYVGSHGHEAQDAAWFARQGFDFLKYDWCSYGQVATGDGRERLIRPYRVMFTELLKQPRDIVLNLCQYGMGAVWEWGAQVGHCSRTTGDLGLEAGGALPGFYRIGLHNAGLGAYAHPGYWNDPDYLLMGWVGDARGMGEGTPTSLTGNEQYSYMSMWSLMAAPLFFSGDMAKLDAFTLNVLCNPEVIDINQDPLGRQARIIRRSDEELILAKPLEDGSLAVGLFNLFEVPRQIRVPMDELGLSGPQSVRDCWRMLDRDDQDGMIEATIPRHGVMLIRLVPKASS